MEAKIKFIDVEVFDKPRTLVRGTLRASKSSNKLRTLVRRNTQELFDLQLKESFESLEFTDPRLFKEIDQALQEISQNTYCGRQVKKKLIPRDFIIIANDIDISPFCRWLIRKSRNFWGKISVFYYKYQINNLWIYNLRKDWRLLYAIANNEIEVLALILAWMNHKDYERLFNF